MKTYNAPTPPTFAVCSVVHNDGLLLAHFIDHYLRQGASHLFLIDHESTDGAIEAVAARWPEFVTVEKGRSPDTTGVDDLWRRIQHQRLRESCVGLYDWTILPDADEFIVSKLRWAHGPALTIAETLQRHPAESVLGTEGYDVIERPDDPPIDWTKPLLPQRTHCFPAFGYYSKPIVLKSDGPDCLTVGHHDLVGRPRPALAPFFLMHLPAIDQESYLARRMNLCQRQSALNLSRNFATHYSSAETHETLLARFRALQALPLQPLPLPPASLNWPPPEPPRDERPPLILNPGGAGGIGMYMDPNRPRPVPVMTLNGGR